MDRDRLTSAHRVHAFVGLPFHADLRRVAAESARHVAANRLGMRRESNTVKDSLHRTRGWLDGLSYAILAEEWARR